MPCDLLLNWYQQHHRDLPWRHHQQPYPIWISEIMLQQTQVKTVLPRYAAWFKQFPDIHSLAEADLDHVLKAWEGLGYYRRARFLHSAANQIVALHKGEFPQQWEDILALPGIGRSTAGAIASFCFNMKTPVLDGNVKRVLKRWHGIEESPDKQLWLLAEQAIEQAASAATWNQAMMELGATVCTPRQAQCTLCPMQKHCKTAFNTHHESPAKPRAAIKDLHWEVELYHHPENGIWLEKRPSKGIWAELWSPPIIELEKAPNHTPCHIHLLTHRRIHLYATFTTKQPLKLPGLWAKKLDPYALPTGIHQLLKKHNLNLHDS
ncbi:MAG: A/G-specific adenine glycosylase [Mariprofundaceae bacterium]